MDQIFNFRDFGGYSTRGGRALKKGLLYRSAHLGNATNADLAELSALGIKTIVDFRNLSEVNKSPDRIPSDPAVQYIHLPIKAIKYNKGPFIYKVLSGIIDEIINTDYEKVSQQSYQSYATDFQAEYLTLLNLLTDPDNLPLLIHCAAGKDRTGVGAALIHLMLDVPVETILQDYLISNQNLQAYQNSMLEKFKFFGKLGFTTDRFQPLFDARQSYLEATFDALHPETETIHEAVWHTFGLTESARNKMVTLLTE